MAGAAVVSVEGLRELTRGLEALGVEIGDLKAAFGDIAREASHLIASATPVRSGKLQASVRGSKASKNRATVSAGSARVPYAAPINYGWPRRNITGAGFMQTSLAPLRIEDKLQDAITRLIRDKGYQ